MMIMIPILSKYFASGRFVVILIFNNQPKLKKQLLLSLHLHLRLFKWKVRIFTLPKANKIETEPKVFVKDSLIVALLYFKE